MKKILVLSLFVFGMTRSAFAHNGVTHGPTEHYLPIHIAHYTVLFGGIAACLVVIYRERKELFKKK